MQLNMQIMQYAHKYACKYAFKYNTAMAYAIIKDSKTAKLHE